MLDAKKQVEKPDCHGQVNLDSLHVADTVDLERREKEGRGREVRKRHRETDGKEGMEGAAV